METIFKDSRNKKRILRNITTTQYSVPNIKITCSIEEENFLCSNNIRVIRMKGVWPNPFRFSFWSVFFSFQHFFLWFVYYSHVWLASENMLLVLLLSSLFVWFYIRDLAFCIVYSMSMVNRFKAKSYIQMIFHSLFLSFSLILSVDVFH